MDKKKKIITIKIPLCFEEDDEILLLSNEEIARKIDETIVIEMSIGHCFSEQFITVSDA